MLDLLCYTLAFVLLGVAAIAPAAVPYRDRMIAAGLAAWVLPTLVTTVQHH